MKIILSYRRADSAGIAGRIFDRFVSHFGADGVFMDIDNIPFGIDFREHIKTELGNSDVVLVVIGLRWLSDGGVRRIDDENDLVRIEVETALRRGIPVIPVLVDGATMPLLQDLPDSLRGLVFRNAAAVDSGRDFSVHIDRLIRSISRLVERSIEETAATPSAAENSSAKPLRPHVSQEVVAAVRRAVNFQAPPPLQAPQTEQIEAHSDDQLLPIRSVRQAPVWMVVVGGCAVIIGLWFTFRYVLISRADHAALEMAKIFPESGRIELKRQIVAPPPPPPPEPTPPAKMPGKNP